MSKVILMLLLAVIVTACADKPTKPISLPDGNQGLVTTCNGRKINWNYCYEAASKACPSGYEISGKNENDFSNEAGTTRSLYFKCN